MDILKLFVQERSKRSEIKLSSFISEKKEFVVKHTINEFEEEVTKTEIIHYWCRIFSSLKRRDESYKFVQDDSSVDWAEILDLVVEGKLSLLSRKRRRFHANLHLEEDRIIRNEIATNAVNTIIPNDKIDRLFMGTDDTFESNELKDKIQKWMDKSKHIKDLHKQDLLYYRILDFTNDVDSSGTRQLLKENYSLTKHYYKSRQNDIKDYIEEGCRDLRNYTQSILGKKTSFKKCIKKAKQERRKKDLKPKSEKFCIRTSSLYKNLTTKEEFNLSNANINENEYTMSFIFPIFNNLFKYSKNIDIRWGEAKLMSKKKEENEALSDCDRRSVGPSIDFIFKMKKNANIELGVGEVSGAPNSHSHEHYLGDRIKIAKNLKSIIKDIINSKTNTERATEIQVYGFQVYQYKVYIYQLIFHNGSYIFLEVDSFSIPTLPMTFKNQLPVFFSNLWKLKNYVDESHKSVVKYLTDPVSFDSPGSTLSSPYVSPQKRSSNSA